MSKIYKVDFSEKDGTETIQELFNSIQLYRQEGKSLSKIYAAFCRAGLWQKSLSSFCNEYYQHRSEQSESTGDLKSKKAKKKTSSKRRAAQPSEESDHNESGTDVASPAANRTGITADMTLAERRAFSAEVFRKRKQ